LQLAIFNSCDGLGLADRLAQLNLPQSIVMREPVPDEVAVEFLKHFFQEFVNNQSLFAAVQKAKKRLEPFKSSYPGAVWLPTICIQPAVRSLTWQGIFDSTSKPLASITSKLLKKIGIILIASLLSFAIESSINFIEPPVYSATTYPAKIKSVDAIPEGTWQYSGSTTWEPIREQLYQKIKRDRLKFQPIYTRHPTLPSGSGTGIKMLLDGEISFAQSSRPISDREYDLAAQRGVRLQQVPVAIDGIAVVVRPDLKIDLAVLQNGEYPLTRRLFVIVEHNNPMDEQAGQTYAKLLLTNEGQEAIEKAGFLPLRSF
jgi:hypothetical protein